MQYIGSSLLSEARRRLAITCVSEGWKQKDAVAFLDVTTPDFNPVEMI